MDTTSTTGQLITCTTDPATGVVLRCTRGASTDPGTCQDIDTDGDGEPHDVTAPRASQPGDRDGDGIPDDQDCDSRPGEDDCQDGTSACGDREDGVALPYAIKPQLASNARPVIDAFAVGGGQPVAITRVAMDTGSWRLTELAAGTAFLVTNGDCLHTGNLGIGHDRVVVTWTTADGETHSNHLDIGYCER